MITLEQCKKTLNRGERKYTNEEIKQIREYLMLLAEMENENNLGKKSLFEPMTFLNQFSISIM
ncbi:hypothetical protein [Segatella buccae]|uniref:hypothetical protein n=1 Tax=Segatella buccae TaxID=28126 RepID=UPI00248E0CCE|nr:hypothetical protein [Segatella buccae]